MTVQVCLALNCRLSFQDFSKFQGEQWYSCKDAIKMIYEKTLSHLLGSL